MSLHSPYNPPRGLFYEEGRQDWRIRLYAGPFRLQHRVPGEREAMYAEALGIWREGIEWQESMRRQAFSPRALTCGGIEACYDYINRRGVNRSVSLAHARRMVQAEKRYRTDEGRLQDDPQLPLL